MNLEVDGTVEARQVTMPVNSVVKPCLHCGNNTSFIFCSTQITNFRYKLYLVCQCGYDPTEYNHSGRGEDVPSDNIEGRLIVAMWYWNRAIEAASNKH